MEKKYIDSEKLVAEIERRKKNNLISAKKCPTGYFSLVANEDIDILSFITSLQQEQPEVDLEKFTEKVRTFQGRYKHPEIVSIKGAMAFMARMFYQYPNTARLWYDRLPKVTMD